MVGQAGASQDAPVSMRPVVPTPSGSTTNEIGTSGSGHHHNSSEAAPWRHPSPLSALQTPSQILPTASSIHRLKHARSLYTASGWLKPVLLTGCRLKFA
ncbi:ash family protein [Kluyvera intermedia]|uniref:ash family protein n=1 Tax=Kluyvera intermedia TaxID=61648 RepID=UPI000F836567|nr:ash family protein [Kluyvera intermedia]WQD27785.1 ash family protein [Kluyvera intermedia]